MYSKKMKRARLAVAILPLFLLAKNVSAKDVETNGICAVAGNYAQAAYSEKTNATDMSLNDVYELLILNLTKTVDFNELDYPERERFVKLVWDAYSFVYNSDDVNEDNVREKAISNCVVKSKIAFEQINKRAVFCQGKGRLIETIAKHREDGSSKAFVRAIYSDLLKGNEKARSDILSVVESVYSVEDFKSSGKEGEKAYTQCLAQ